MLATETDQFTTPPRRLFDIGPMLSRKIVEIIEADQSQKDPDQILARWVGRNVIRSRMSAWVKGIPGTNGLVRFRPSLRNSVYRRTISPAVASFLFDSPTVNVHGHYMGTDKIDHFFQQGHEYYARVSRKEAKGIDTATAISKAVARGVKQEHSYFGTLASGIFSNADLAANYAGMKFYLNLRRPVQIGDKELTPLFERTPEGWRLRAGVDRDHLLDPYISDHFDESLNPSRYRFSRASIRSLIEKRCAEWGRFYSDRLALVAPANESFATLWFGEEYGHWLPQNEEVSIANTCPALGPQPVS